MVWTLFWWFVLLPAMVGVVVIVVGTPVVWLLKIVVDFNDRREAKAAEQAYAALIARQGSKR